MKGMIVLGVMLGVVGLGEYALGQTLKSPEASAAQTQAEAKPAPDDLVTLLEAKGILTETEAALVSQAQVQPQTKLVLAEMLLSKHLIDRKEYDQTLQSCSTSPAPAQAANEPVTPFILGWNGNGEYGDHKSFSDRMASILPYSGGTTGLDFGTIQPSPMWAPGEKSQKAHAKTKHKANKHHRQDASQTTSGSKEGAPKP